MIAGGLNCRSPAREERPKANLQALIAASVANGTLASRRTWRMNPTETRNSHAGPGVYTSLFQRLVLSASPPVVERPPASRNWVFDLFPQLPHSPQRMVLDFTLLSDAEGAEDQVENVVGGGGAGDFVEGAEGSVEVEQKHLVRDAGGDGIGRVVERGERGVD